MPEGEELLRARRERMAEAKRSSMLANREPNPKGEQRKRKRALTVLLRQALEADDGFHMRAIVNELLAMASCRDPEDPGLQLRAIQTILDRVDGKATPITEEGELEAKRVILIGLDKSQFVMPSARTDEQRAADATELQVRLGT